MKHYLSCKERLQENILTLYVNDTTSFYGACLLQFYFVKADAEKCNTFGVTFTSKGVVLFYNENFMNTISDSSLEFILIHEVMHVLYGHINHHIIYSDRKIANIAQDAVINTNLLNWGFDAPKNDILKDLVEGKVNLKPEDSFLEYAKIMYASENLDDDKMNELVKKILKNCGLNETATIKEYSEKPSCVLFEPDYKDLKTTFNYYKYLTEKSDYTAPESQMSHMHLELTQEELDTMLENSEMSGAGLISDEDTCKASIDDIIANAKYKSKGSMPGNLEETINNLRKTKTNYLKEIIKGINFVNGRFKTKTYKREPRRGVEGLKGTLKYNSKLNVILDTSGSMSGEFDMCLSVLFSRNIVCNLIQVDTAIKSVTEVTSDRDLRKVAIQGLGGTYLTPAIEYIASNPKLNQFNTVILTDGETEKLDCTNLKRTLILTTRETPDVLGSVKIIKIENN